MIIDIAGKANYNFNVDFVENFHICKGSKNMQDYGIWRPIDQEEAYALFKQLQIPWWMGY